MNELFLVISLFLSFGASILFLKLFGKSGLFAWIGICTILADIEVTILVHAFGMDQTLGNTLFASSFLATDILSEVYGKKDADKGVLVGILTTILFMVFSFMWTNYVPAESGWSMPAIRSLFSRTPRILIASLAAYIISESFDVWLYHTWWNLTAAKTGDSKKFLWLRNNFSTLLSQMINIIIFNFGAFIGVYSWSELLKITVACYLIYIVTSLLDTPFVYLGRKIGKQEIEEEKKQTEAKSKV